MTNPITPFFTSLILRLKTRIEHFFYFQLLIYISLEERIILMKSLFPEPHSPEMLRPLENMPTALVSFLWLRLHPSCSCSRILYLNHCYGSGSFRIHIQLKCWIKTRKNVCGSATLIISTYIQIKCTPIPPIYLLFDPIPEDNGPFAAAAGEHTLRQRYSPPSGCRTSAPLCSSQ